MCDRKGETNRYTLIRKKNMAKHYHFDPAHRIKYKESEIEFTQIN